MTTFTNKDEQNCFFSENQKIYIIIIDLNSYIDKLLQKAKQCLKVLVLQMEKVVTFSYQINSCGIFVSRHSNVDYQ